MIWHDPALRIEGRPGGQSGVAKQLAVSKFIFVYVEPDRRS
jgi:hypothetical protein